MADKETALEGCVVFERHHETGQIAGRRWAGGPSSFLAGPQPSGKDCPAPVELADLRDKTIKLAEWGEDQDQDSTLRLTFTDGTQFLFTYEGTAMGSALVSLETAVRLTQGGI